MTDEQNRVTPESKQLAAAVKSTRNIDPDAPGTIRMTPMNSPEPSNQVSDAMQTVLTDLKESAEQISTFVADKGLAYDFEAINIALSNASHVLTGTTAVKSMTTAPVTDAMIRLRRDYERGTRFGPDGSVVLAADLRTVLDWWFAQAKPEQQSDVVERVARAIEDDLSKRHYGIPGDWDGLPEYQRGERIFAARAALAALDGEAR